MLNLKKCFEPIYSFNIFVTGYILYNNFNFKL